jgi:hypothetical protein
VRSVEGEDVLRALVALPDGERRPGELARTIYLAMRARGLSAEEVVSIAGELMGAVTRDARGVPSSR